METSFYMIPAVPHNNKNYSVNNIITDNVNRFRSSFFFNGYRLLLKYFIQNLFYNILELKYQLFYCL